MTNSVTSAIEAAKAAAAAQTDNQPPIEMEKMQAPGQAVASYAAAVPMVPTLDTLTQASRNVDEWLKAPEHGLQIGSKPGLIQNLKAEISLADIGVFYGVRFGNPAVYFKSYDKVTCVQGGTWNDALAKAQKADPQCKGEYMGTDLTLVAHEDIKGPAGEVLLEAGKRLGHSSSITGTKTVSDFVKEARALGYADTDTLIVNVKHKRMSKPGVRDWGVLEFEILGKKEA